MRRFGTAVFWRSSALLSCGVGFRSSLISPEQPEEKNTKPLRFASVIPADSDFEAINHYYPKILNAEIHPLVNYFLSLGVNRIAQRFDVFQLLCFQCVIVNL